MAKGRQSYKKRGERDTYYPVLDRGEVSPRCKFCGAVVPVRLWWHHICQEERKSESQNSSQNTTSYPQGSGEGKQN